MVLETGRLRRALRACAWMALVAIVIAAVLFVPRAGTYLVEADPLSKSDVVFALGGARVERWLEACDLYKAGYAPVILLSPGLVEPAELELRVRGVTFPSDSELARDALIQLGVPAPAIVAPAQSVDNTAAEAVLLRRMAAEHGWRSAIVVTSKYHSRRTAFAFQREFRESGIRVSIWPSKYDAADPAHWWRRRYDVRFVTWEWQKLIAYRLGLGG